MAGTCQFVGDGRRHTLPLGRVSEAEARAKAAQVDYLLMRLKQGLIALPPGVALVELIRHDGSPPVASPKPDPAPPRKEPTLADPRDRDLDTHAHGTLEVHTVEGIRRHFGHLARILGEGFKIRELTLADLQDYVDCGPRPRPRAGADRSTR